MRAVLSITMAAAALACGKPEPLCERDIVSDTLRAVLTRAHQRNPVPGMSAAIYSPARWEQPIAVAIGVADREQQLPLTVNHHFLAGSVGKTWWAALALRMASAGALNLDQPIGHAFKAGELPRADVVTPRMLLLHTTGYPEYDNTFMTALVREPLRARTTDDWLGVLRRGGLSDTGVVRYSDLNYIVLASLLDRLSGDSAYARIQSELLTPLGLAQTRPARTPEATGLAIGYDGPGGLFARDRLEEGGQLIYNPQFEFGGGGFISTPADLARWFAAFRQGRAFPDSLWRMVVAPPPGVGDTVSHWKGLGVDVIRRGRSVDIFHTGYIPGYLSFVQWFEAESLAVALQVNSSVQAQLPDDPMTWLTEIAVKVPTACRVSTASAGGQPTR